MKKYSTKRGQIAALTAEDLAILESRSYASFRVLRAMLIAERAELLAALVAVMNDEPDCEAQAIAAIDKAHGNNDLLRRALTTPEADKAFAELHRAGEDMEAICADVHYGFDR